MSAFCSTRTRLLWALSEPERLGQRARMLIADRSSLVADDHALLAGSLDWAHRDPFDRMLAAQAMIESLVLVSADDVFSDLRGLTVVW